MKINYFNQKEENFNGSLDDAIGYINENSNNLEGFIEILNDDGKIIAFKGSNSSEWKIGDRNAEFILKLNLQVEDNGGDYTNVGVQINDDGTITIRLNRGNIVDVNKISLKRR